MVNRPKSNTVTDPWDPLCSFHVTLKRCTPSGSLGGCPCSQSVPNCIKEPEVLACARSQWRQESSPAVLALFQSILPDVFSFSSRLQSGYITMFLKKRASIYIKCIVFTAFFAWIIFSDPLSNLEKLQRPGLESPFYGWRNHGLVYLVHTIPKY